MITQEKLWAARLSLAAQVSCLLAGIASIPVFATAQTREPFRPDTMDTILYGAAYYPEYCL